MRISSIQNSGIYKTNKQIQTSKTQNNKQSTPYKINMLYNTKSRRGVAQFGSALGSGPRGRGFKSRHLDQKTTGFDLSFFYPSRRLGISSLLGAYHHRRCISSRISVYFCGLMICKTSFWWYTMLRIDDIHGFAVIEYEGSNPVSKTAKISFL